MASTYSTNLKIELMGTGEQSGQWGNKTNTNLGTLIEQAIVGYTTQAILDVGDTTITIADGASSAARNYVLQLTGTLTNNRNLIVPAIQKPYVIFNTTSGGYSVTVKVAGQTGVTVANGKKAIVYVNGTDVIEVANAPVTEAGTQTLTNKTISNSSGAFTTLSASSTVSGAGFSTYLASPPAIGGSTPAAGAFTTLSASGTVSGVGFSNYLTAYLAAPSAIGGTTPAGGAFTTLSASSTVSGTGFSNYLASPPAIGGTTPAAGSFTTIRGATYSGTVTTPAALDIDCSTANYFTKTISADSTFTFSNAPASRGYTFLLELNQTSGIVTWPASVQWPNGVAPSLTTGKTHLFCFTTDDGGTRWRGSSSVNYTT